MKGLAQLDQLSGGRLLLSFVPGLGLPSERAALGWSGGDRGAVLERVLGVARSWWAGALPAGDPAPEGACRARPPCSGPTRGMARRARAEGPLEPHRPVICRDGWLGALVTPEEAEGAARLRIDAAQGSERRTSDGS